MPHGFRAPVLILDAESEEYPISIKEVGANLRLSKDQMKRESNLLTMIISAVTECAEDWTRRDFLTKEWTQLQDCFPGGGQFFAPSSDVLQEITLFKSPLQSVESIEYLSNDETTTIVVAAADYYIDQQDDYSGVLPIPNVQWPTDISARLQAVQIKFKTGFGDKPIDTPKGLRLAMVHHAAYFYANRGDCGCTSANATEVVPGEVEGVYDSHRIIRMAL